MLEPATQPQFDDGFIRRLSPRETEVLQMTSLGLTNAEIAARLKVTSHAVKFHLSSIYRKLGVANRTEAVVVFLRNQTVDTG